MLLSNMNKISIAEYIRRGKDFRASIRARAKGKIAGLPKDILYVGVLFFACIVSFALGMLVERDLGARKPFTITTPGHPAVPENAAAPLPAGSREVVMAKNGRVYYYAWCSGASRIRPENRVTLASAAIAEARGYALSATCKPR